MEVLFSKSIYHCGTTLPHLLIYFDLVNIFLCSMGPFSVNLLLIVSSLIVIFVL